MPDRPFTLARTLVRFGPMLRPQIRRIVWILVASLLASLFAVLGPVPVKLIIDGVLAGKPPQWLPLANANYAVLVLASAAALIAMLAAIFSALEKRASARAREQLTRTIRLACLDRFLLLTPLCAGNDRQGELALRLIDDSQHVSRLFAKTGPVVVRYLLVLAMTLAAMTWVDPRLGLLALAIALVLSAMMRLAARPLARTAQKKRKQEGRVAASAQEILRLLGFLQSSGSECFVRDRFDAINRDALSAGVEETAAAVRLERTMQFANGLALAIIAGIGGILALRGAITPGDLAIAILYLNQMLKPVEKINELASAIAGATSRAGRLAELLDRPELLDRTGTHDKQYTRAALTLEGVRFAYPGGQDIEFGNRIIPAGSLVSVEGPSGTGKSTLFAMLTRLFDPAEGSLALNGTQYRDWNLAALRAHFAIAPQSPPLLAGTVREWLELGNPEASEAQCWAALSAVALEKAVRLKGGLDAGLGEGGTGFSGGEQARLSLARALLSDRPVLLLDEPLANVDAGSAAIILAALAKEKGKRTILIVSHQALPQGLADLRVSLAGHDLEFTNPALEAANA